MQETESPLLVLLEMRFDNNSKDVVSFDDENDWIQQNIYKNYTTKQKEKDK